jgi:hypothetical protein
MIYKITDIFCLTYTNMKYTIIQHYVMCKNEHSVLMIEPTEEFYGQPV